MSDGVTVVSSPPAQVTVTPGAPAQVSITADQPAIVQVTGPSEVTVTAVPPAIVEVLTTPEVQVQVTQTSQSMVFVDTGVGSPGPAGSVWRHGDGPPDNSLGANNDLYLDDLNGDVYQKLADVYSLATNIIGPAGPVSPATILHETSGPTDLTIGDILDGQIGQRVGSTFVGVDSVPPSGHGASHIGTGSDPVPDAIASGAAGLLSGTDKQKLDDATSASTPTTLMERDGSGRAQVVDPVSAQDIASKAYVDAVAVGLTIKGPALCATTANITLSGEQTLDGILTSSSVVLVKNQLVVAQNGLYVSAAGAWTRVTNMDVWAEVPGAFCFVEEGSIYAATGWVCTANPSGTIGVTAVPWTQFSGAGTYTAGTGLLLTGSQFSADFGTTSGKTAQGDDSRFTDSRTPTAHATSHKSGGTDQIKLDELAAPTDITTLNASTSAHGLLRKLDNNSAHFLDGTGGWTTPPGVAPPTGTGFVHITSGSEDGAAKLVDTADINTHQVTNTILAQMAAHTFKGNNTGSTANAADLTITQLSAELAGTSGTTLCVGNDSRLSDSRTPTSHHTSHEAGGSDPIKLDDLAAPDNNTDLDVSITAHGLAPKLPNDATKFLDGTGAYTVPTAGAPLAHAASHESGGSDPIPLDTLAAPTDITTLNASNTAHGLLRKLDNVSTHFLDGTGAWAVPVTAHAMATAEALSVANINDASAELSAITGMVKGEMRRCYKTNVGNDEWVLYVWDNSSAASQDIPYLINGSTGQWEAIAGKYMGGASSFTASRTAFLSGTYFQAPYFISTIPTGSPPMTAVSTTKVTNFNADLLDDQDGTDYHDASQLFGTIPFDVGLPSHATTHEAGGGDPIALDTLDVPTDITTLNASTSAHGLLRKLDGNSAHFLDGTGAWSTPAGGGGGSATVRVRVISKSNLTLSGTQTVDGVALSATDRIAVAAQTAPAENGIYAVAAGAWARTADADTWAELMNLTCIADEGTEFAYMPLMFVGLTGGTLDTDPVKGEILWPKLTGGDVTYGATPSSDLLATIANNAVTNAKAAQMAAHTFKGNNTGSTANASDLTITQLSAELAGTSSTTLCVGNDSRLSDSRTPTSHASTHLASGGDPLLGAPGPIGAGTASTGDFTALTGGSGKFSVDTTGCVTNSNNLNVDGSNNIVNTTTKSVALYAYDVQRTGSTVAGITIGGVLVSAVSTGTAPLTVTSTTKVTNLNADKLDDQHGSFYQDADNLNAGTVAAARMPALTGDITTSAGSVATTLANSGVTNATYGDGTHVPQIAVDVKGRITSASNVVITGVTYSATSTTSQPIAHSGTITVTTQTGLAYLVGDRIRLSSAATPTDWMEGYVSAYNSGTGSMDVTLDLDSTQVGVATVASDFLSTLSQPVTAITGTASVGSFSTLYKCTGTSADYTVTLPAVSGNAGRFMAFRGGTSSELTKVVTIDGNGSETIQSARLSISLLWDEFLVLYCDGTQWWIVHHVHAANQAFTPTINGASSNPTKGSTRRENCWWRRVGQYMEIQFTYAQSNAGSSGSGDYLYVIPGGFTIDSTYADIGQPNAYATSPSDLGGGFCWINGISGNDVTVWAASTTALSLVIFSSTAHIGSGSYALGNSGVNQTFNARVPIVGW